MDSLLFIAAYILAVLFSIVLHELAHGLMAYQLGDPTAKNLGRLTLNPIKHLDLFGSIILPLLTGIPSHGSIVFGYAKPVPYNPLYLNDRKFGSAKVAIVGPLVNLVIAFLFALLLRWLPNDWLTYNAWHFIGQVVLINIWLAIFNLVPLPPLDGHWILLSLLPERYVYWKSLFQRFGIIFFLVFVFFLSPLIFPLVRTIFFWFTGSQI